MNKKLIVLLSIFLVLSMAGQMAAMGNQASTAISTDQYTVPSEIKLGGLFPLTGTLAGGGVERDAAARMAIKAINEDNSLLPDTTLTLIVEDTQTDPATGSSVASKVISDGAVGIVGAASSSVSISIAGGPAKTNKVPQISYSSTNPDLSDKEKYPYFLRVVPSDAAQGIAVANLINEWGWTQVATLATSDDYGLGGIGVVEDTLDSLGIDVVSTQRFAQGATDIKTQLQSIIDKGAKIIVLNVIVGDAKTVFSQAADLGMTAEEGYVWVGTDGPTQGAVFEGSDTIKSAMQGMVGTKPQAQESAVLDDFLDLWEDCYGADNNTYAGCGDRTPNTYATFAYDAVYMFAHALQTMITNEEDVNDGDLLLATLKETSFSGVTGTVSFNSQGDRDAVYDIVNLQGNAFEIVGSYDQDNGAQFSGTIYWDGSSVTEIPDDGSGDTGGIPGFELYLALFSLIVAVPIVRRIRK